MNKVLYTVTQGTIHELEYILDNGKYRLASDNVLSKRVVIETQLDVIHGKKFNAYVISFDLDKAIDIYVKYISKCMEQVKYELEVLENYREVQ